MTISLLKASEGLAEVSEVYFQRGDTVDVRLASTTAEAYRFFKAAEKEVYFSASPLAPTGNRLESNITGSQEALGVWAAYNSSYFRVVLR
ncbi:MAG: hypothetical protein HC842_08390 [Cytophagales bacterium]|nr:hypothetical protein [Cytophagales bacterium]